MTAEGPATVTLTDDERAFRPGCYCDAHYSVGQGKACGRWRDREARRLHAEHAARVGALTADLAAARRGWEQCASDEGVLLDNLVDAEQVIANVRALADALWHEGNRASQRRSYPQGVAYRYAAGRIRALLPAAPTGEGE